VTHFERTSVNKVRNTLKMEVARSSETLVSYSHITQRHTQKTSSWSSFRLCIIHYKMTWLCL